MKMVQLSKAESNLQRVRRLSASGWSRTKTRPHYPYQMMSEMIAIDLKSQLRPTNTNDETETWKLDSFQVCVGIGYSQMWLVVRETIRKVPIMIFDGEDRRSSSQITEQQVTGSCETDGCIRVPRSFSQYDLSTGGSSASLCYPSNTHMYRHYSRKERETDQTEVSESLFSTHVHTQAAGNVNIRLCRCVSSSFINTTRVHCWEKAFKYVSTD